MADYRLTQSGDEVQEILNNSTPQSDLTAETQRAEQAEQALQGNINNEERDRKAADVTLQGHIDDEETRAKAAEKQNADNIDAIEEKIPAAASSSNKLVDEQKMNSSIATATATYRGYYNLVTDLHLTVAATESDVANALDEIIVTADNNDYCYVMIPVANDKPTEIARIDRYKFNGSTWGLEYSLNNSGYTAAQWDAINSGITSGLVTKLNLLPTKTELDLLLNAKAPQATTYTKAEVDALIANFITASVNNLVNYYLKSDTYTKAEIQQLVDAVKQFTYQSVAELPAASADTMNKIYLVPSSNPETKNVKDEFITIATIDQGLTTYSWEQIGSTAIDLSGYYTSLQTDAAIANALAAYSTTEQMNTTITTAINTALVDYSTTSQMTAAIATAIANYYTKAEVDALIANFITASVNNLVNYYLKSETFTKAEVNQLIAAVQQFTYQSVAELPTASADTMNKIYLVPSTNPQTKNVKDEYITIATTDQGLTTYSWEQIGSTEVDLSGYYTSTQTDAAINTALSAYSTTTQMTAAIATAIANYYTKSEVDELIANFITKAVNDLTYYYLKSETYNKTEVDAMVAAIQQFQLVSVQTLPTASADTMNKIYLVPGTDPQTGNVKDEYITLAVTENNTTTYSWECIGSTEISLDNYYTKTQTDNVISGAITLALGDYSTTSEVGTLVSTAITTALANYYTKIQVDGLVNGKYTKPGTGIPESDLAAALADKINGAATQASLNNTNGRVLFLEQGLGKYDNVRSITLQQDTAGKYVNVNGQEVSASGYGISSEVQLNAGDIMLVPSASAVPADVSLFARIVTRTYDKVINYTYTYRQDYPELPATATADYNPALIYTAQYNETGDTPVLTGWLMGGQIYTTLPATREVTESYYEPLMKQAVAAMPSTGYYVYLCPTAMTIVISGYTATVSGGVAMVVGLGIFKNIATNFIGAPGQAVLAQAFAQMFGEIQGLKARLDNLGDVRAICVNSEDVPKVQNYPMIIYGSGAPSAPDVPAFIGQKYLDMTNKKEYTAFSVTNSVSDWVLMN